MRKVFRTSGNNATIQSFGFVVLCCLVGLIHSAAIVNETHNVVPSTSSNLSIEEQLLPETTTTLDLESVADSTSPSSELQNVNQTDSSISSSSTIGSTFSSQSSIETTTATTTTTTSVPLTSVSTLGTNSNSTNSSSSTISLGPIQYDPSQIIVLGSKIQSLAKNASKLVLKYVQKPPSQTDDTKFKSKQQKQTELNFTKFIPKYFSKAVGINETSEIKIEKFKDFMPDHIRENGGVIVHIILLIYVCLSLGLICDLYFLTSIEYIGNTLKLPADIAGATFMALGTSAPELFVALIGVFIAEDDIGTSTILGSAVFNLIFVPGVCGFAIYLSDLKYPKINKYSILRDAIFYMIAITTLMLALKDNEIDWLESVCMLSVFCIYLYILYLNAQLGELVEFDEDEDGETSESGSDNTSESGRSECTPLLSEQPSVAFTRSEKHNFTKSADWIEHGRLRNGSLRTAPFARTNSIRTSSIRNGSMLGLPNGYQPIEAKCDTPAKCPPQHEEPNGMPENWAESHWLLQIITFPIVLLIKITVPKPNKQNYFLTFVISILWISMFTYSAVWLVTVIGNTFKLPDTVIGLTILAAGASIPEVISSVIVVKRAGLANMALCNLFGSNIFDILICLGLPWLIKNCINMYQAGNAELLTSVVIVQSNGLILTTFTLLMCVVGFVCTLAFNRWRLGLGVGIMCVTIYAIAISLASCYEIFLN